MGCPTTCPLSVCADSVTVILDKIVLCLGIRLICSWLDLNTQILLFKNSWHWPGQLGNGHLTDHNA